MCDRNDYRHRNNDYNEGVYWVQHNVRLDEGNAHFSVEPSNEKDYDIYLMTGNNNGKDSEKK